MGDLTLPIIDLTPLRDGSDPASVARALDDACTDLGFFVVVGHSIDPMLRDEMFARAREFFALPTPEKEAIAIASSPCHAGYSGLAGETLEPGMGADLKEALDIGIERGPDHPEVVAGTPLHGPSQWPAIDGFRETATTYIGAALETMADVMSGMALALDLPADHFRPLYDDPLCWLRLLHYPPSSAARPGADQPGCGAHSDYGSVTLLTQDDVGGLQVKARDGRWLDVTTEPDMLVVNLGDMIARWTNDRYVSTEHRVVSPTERDRYSMPFFTAPNYHTLVDAIPSCVTAEAPRRFEPVEAGRYMSARFDDTHAYRNPELAGR
ncbi:MAG: 2-oxoglutarate and iron-dependent oxygenase domain-containing protein [Actinomycetota bacterium]|nr:2-oxoglutarate and iron-dependent oxygenase domain-containing protein [Actinomycetota bacterium]